MLNEKLLNLLNQQVNKELYSSYLYFTMSNHLHELSFYGASNWFKKQASEEFEHATKLMDYIHQENGKVHLEAIKVEPFKFQTLKEAFEITLKHEQYVTSLIHDLFALARELKDYRSELFLTWFVNEQSEEENSVNTLLEKINLIGDCKNLLLKFDSELASR